MAEAPVVAWIPYSLLTYRFWHNIDDAFISFRYAKNWAMGYGPRYNLGLQQPEEGYSNFLWVVVCTFIEYLELDITFWHRCSVSSVVLCSCTLFFERSGEISTWGLV